MSVATVLAPNSLHQSLISALESNDPEPALDQAFVQLQRGGDLKLLLAMVKAMVRVGLAGLAPQLIYSIAGAMAAEPRLAALAKELEALPSGEILRDVLQNRHVQHLQALNESHSHLRSVLE